MILLYGVSPSIIHNFKSMNAKMPEVTRKIFMNLRSALMCWSLVIAYLLVTGTLCGDGGHWIV